MKERERKKDEGGDGKKCGKGRKRRGRRKEIIEDLHTNE